MNPASILLMSATLNEIKPLIDKYSFKSNDGIFFQSASNLAPFDILITGIGIHAMIYTLTKHLFTHSCRFVINAGICGALNHDLQIGDVCVVVTDEFSDFGVEYPDGFKTLFAENLLDADEPPFRNGRLYSDFNTNNYKSINALRKVSGSTSQTVHGRFETIAEIRTRCNPDVETMEGAAAFYVCKRAGIDILQIRSVSNYVEPRNKAKWNIEMAVNNLNIVLENLIMDINESSQKKEGVRGSIQ